MNKTNNKLIAEFMGVKPKEGDFFDGYELSKAGLPFAYGAMGNGTNDLKFYSSWDWLMPVVEEINGFRIGTHDRFLTFTIDIGEKKATISDVNIWYENKDKILLNAVYKTVVDFIKWYNKQN